jgi:hypothetical protein
MRVAVVVVALLALPACFPPFFPCICLVPCTDPSYACFVCSGGNNTQQPKSTTPPSAQGESAPPDAKAATLRY